jgi:nicotinate-nucleotide adenylyltransferase
VAVAGRTGILGGVFDPPHNGHVALARAALRELGLGELFVLVVADPGHKRTTTDAETRLELTRLALEDVAGVTVELDPHARTVDSLEERQPIDAVFVIGADELADFETWKSPERILELVDLGVAMRPGTSADAVRGVAKRLGAAHRVLEFEMRPVPISSSEIRDLVAGRQPVDDLVPAKVADAIRRLGLYTRAPE